MNNNDYYFSRLDRLDGLDTRGPKPYVALVTIKPKPAPTLAPSWSPIRFAIILVVVALAVIVITGAVVIGAVLA